MVTQQEIDRQLSAIGANFRWWGKSEVNELQHILVPHENIMYCLNGRYEGGFAMLCVTDQRLILVDKKPFNLTLEDVRYDMVAEVDFSQRLYDATISVITVNKKLNFSALRGSLLRKATSYLQNRVMEFRQQHMMPTPQGMPYIQTPVEESVNAIQHRITNPYTKVPLMMRRRINRFYSG